MSAAWNLQLRSDPIPNEPEAMRMAGKSENSMTDRAASMAHDTTDRAAEMAHDTVDRVADVADDAEKQLRKAAGRKMKQARQVQDDMLEAVDDKLGKVDSYVKENPFTAVGIAFAVGAIVSALIRR
jgi:ElaB/YqjD/DUF883 family membrane-anchored ribosome-binding protein